MLLCLLMMIFCVPANTAATEAPDTQRPVSLTVSFRSNDATLAGLPFDLYLVATMDEYGELTVTEPFDQFNIDIRGENDQAWRTLASTLEGYAPQYAAPIDSGMTDEQGQVFFPNRVESLPHGLYFVPGFRFVQEGFIYEAESFLVLLPGTDRVNNSFIYDVPVQPKYSQSEDLPLVRRVLKVWNDNGDSASRPEEIVVQLLRNGEVYDTVTLSAENDWRWLWIDLSGHYRWSVAEQIPEGYTAEITREGVTFVLTNTPTSPTPPDEPETPDEPQLPQTGQLWWPVPILTTAGLLFLSIGLMRRKGERHA